jgi:hypothetical protein
VLARVFPGHNAVLNELLFGHGGTLRGVRSI